MCKSNTSCGSDCAACSAPTPACLDRGNGTSVCVQCITNTDCPVATPVCDAAANTCVAQPASRSCTGLAANCGANGNDNCCASSQVPGGTYYRSYDTVKFTAANAPATVSTFTLDDYEVTVGRFRNFVKAYSQNMTAEGSGKNPNNSADPGWDSAWNTSLPASTADLTAAMNCHPTYHTWTDSPPDAGVGNETLPINCMDWYTAEAFCIWDGGRLPTEAEWNYAAGGGNEQREYTWTPNSEPGSNTDLLIYNCWYHGTGPGSCTGLTNIAPVGSAPAGKARWGQLDMSGGVWEWVQDYYASYDVPCNNCAHLATSTQGRVFRGGAFSDAPGYQLSGYRFYSSTPRGFTTGVRCAR